MSDAGNLVAALVTGGVGAALGSIGTALVQSVSKRGESRAVAADRVTQAAGNLADRLDKMVVDLEQENIQMRKAINALVDLIEEVTPLLPESVRPKARQAVRASRLALR